MQTIIDTLVAFGAWLLDLVLWVPRQLFSLLADETVELVNVIPCANACYQVVQSAGTVLTGAQLPDGAAGGAAFTAALNWLSLAVYTSGVIVGLELAMCALLARFVLRRIPLVG